MSSSSKSKALVIEPIAYKKPGSCECRDLIDPDMPLRPPFMAALIGMRGSGKSTALVNFFKFWGEHFRAQDVILCSPSMDTDPMMELIPAGHKMDSFRPAILESVIMQQKALISDNRLTAPDLLIILDDCITERSFTHGGIVELLGYRGRHLKISVIFSVQKYSALSRGIRLNCSHLMFYKTHNKSELNWILDEHSEKETRQTFRKMLDYCWKTPHSFLLCDYWTTDESLRYRKNLDQPLTLDDFQ